MGSLNKRRPAGHGTPGTMALAKLMPWFIRRNATSIRPERGRMHDRGMETRNKPPSDALPQLAAQATRPL